MVIRFTAAYFVILSKMKSNNNFRKEMAHYYRDKWKRLNTAIGKASKKADEQPVHKARIAIKKMVSLFHFIQYCNGDFDSEKEAKPLHKIFKAMGKVRDYNNMLRLCAKFNIDRAIFDHKEPGQEKAYKKLHSKCHHFKEQTKHIRKEGANLLKYANIEKWRAYIRNEEQATRTKAASELKQAMLHPMRKDIKNIVYNAEIHAIKGVIARVELDMLDKLQDTIGSWHDMVDLRSQAEVINYGLSHKKQALAIKREEQKLYKDVMTLCRKIKTAAA
jgi:CHAD domain-containing protein